MLRHFTLLLISIIGVHYLSAQSAGDTIRVQAFTYNSDSRDIVVNFPDRTDLTYEKILLKYSMRCKGGLVSTVNDRNLGCGEWDFSNNTYLIDSTRVETLSSLISSHFITNFDGDVFPYSSTPTFNYLRGTQTDVQVQSIISETSGTLGTNEVSLDRTLTTNHQAGKSQYIYTADELLAAGLSSGELDALSLNVLGNAGEAQFLKILMKHTAKDEMNGLIDTDGFTEVYYNNTTLVANSANRFQFSTPFEWDGESNLLVEFNFTNATTNTLLETLVEGESTDSILLGATTTNEQEIMLTNQSYIECTNFTGLAGNTNRTIEAWIRTTDGSTNGEIMAWGTQVTGAKYTFRLVNGRLRVEVHGGGTESTTAVDDGEWHHVACVLDGNNVGQVRFYIDGVLDQNQVSGTTAINSNNNSAKVRISRGVNNRYIDGTIDDVRLWDAALSEETLNEWKSLKIDESHPNFANLQLNYEFNESGTDVIDSSVRGRNGFVVGERYNISQVGGPTLFKDFILSEVRPVATFYQGDYETNVVTTEVDRPIAKSPRHLVIEREIEKTDPNFALDDNILINGPNEIWTLDERVYDELTGELIEENNEAQDGEINISELEYDRRFPFYNELVSFVTPYGINLDLGDGISWYMDMSDYLPILKGDKRMQMTLGGQRQEEMNLEFLFIVGTPPRDVLQYEQIWQGTNRIGIARIDQILDDTKFAPADVQLDANASTFVLKSSVTGHGSEGEFGQNGGPLTHFIDINGDRELAWNITQECAFNPIFPQGGTWVLDREGWCPGERTLLMEQDITSHVQAGQSVNIDYTTTAPLFSTGDYRYHVAHQIVGYGEANFETDASMINIMAPNSSAEFTRVGTICSDPVVQIRNTGANPLTSLIINYWLNDSTSPQTYEWTGNLAFMEDALVTIPAPEELWFDILSEGNQFHVELSNPNQSADQYSFNNTMTSDFNFPDVLPSDIVVEVRTNNVPIQNAYTLEDANTGEIIGSNNLSASNFLFRDNYELPDGCYKLSVTDTGHDGLEFFANLGQGAGSVRILSASIAPIITFSPDFGGGFEYYFSTTFPVSSEDLSFLTSINVFPNPASNIVTVEADDISEAVVYLTDISGRRVNASTVERAGDRLTLDISYLQSGYYIVVIEKEEVRTTRKLIVE